MTERCSEVQEILKRSWADHDLLPFLPREEEEPGWLESLEEKDCAVGRALLDAEGDWINAHLMSCPRCQGEVSEIGRLDRTLLDGLTTLEGWIGPPSEECVGETLRKLREGSCEAVLIRRIRRPLRIIIWGVFYVFTLLACCVLAVALYKALRGLP